MAKEKYTLIENYGNIQSVMWWLTDPVTGKRKRVKISTGTSDVRMAHKLAPTIIQNYQPRAVPQGTETPGAEQSHSPNRRSAVAGGNAKPTPESIMSDVRDYFIEIHRGKKEQKTLKHIASAFNSFITEIGDVSIGGIDNLDIAKWQSRYLEKRSKEYGIQLSTTTGLSAYHRSLQARFQELVKAEILIRNVFIGNKPKSLKRDPKGKAWTVEERDLILSTADALVHKRDKRKRSTVLPLIPHFIRLGLVTGMRTEELCSLRWEQIKIDPEDGLVKIWLYQNETKTDEGRKVKLTKTAQRILEEIKRYYETQTMDPELNPFVYNATINCPAETVQESVRLYLIKTVGERTADGFYAMFERGTNAGQIYVFDIGYNQPWDYGNVASNFLKVIKATGLKKSGNGRTIGKRYSIYETRHTFAVESLKRGMKITDLKEVLGHSSIDQTMMYGTSERYDMPEIVL